MVVWTIIPLLLFALFKEVHIPIRPHMHVIFIFNTWAKNMYRDVSCASKIFFLILDMYLPLRYRYPRKGQHNIDEINSGNRNIVIVSVIFLFKAEELYRGILFLL